MSYCKLQQDMIYLNEHRALEKYFIGGISHEARIRIRKCHPRIRTHQGPVQTGCKALPRFSRTQRRRQKGYLCSRSQRRWLHHQRGRLLRQHDRRRQALYYRHRQEHACRHGKACRLSQRNLRQNRFPCEED